MNVYLVWYGYEDVEKVFLHRENAEKYVEKELSETSWRRKENYSICEEEIADT
jgi:hypothetical protein